MKLLRSEMLKHEMHRGFAAVHIFHQGSKFHSTAPQAPFHAHRAFHVRSTFHDGVISFIFGGRMSNNVLVDMSMDFAAAIVTLCDGIKGKTAITNQLLRSGTSIGANIHEANYAQSKADFVSKLQIALKECYESEYWLQLFSRTAIITAEQYSKLKNDCGKIRRILISSINTTKENHNL